MTSDKNATLSRQTDDLWSSIELRYIEFIIPVLGVMVFAMMRDLVPQSYYGMASSSNLAVWWLQAFGIFVLPLLALSLVVDLIIERYPMAKPYIFAPLWALAMGLAMPNQTFAMLIGGAFGLWHFATHYLEAKRILANQAATRA